MSVPPVLSYSGVTLRPLEVDRDLASLHAIFGNADAMRYMFRAPQESEEGTHALVEAWCADKLSPQWAITAHGDESVALGRITLVAQREGVMEIGVQTVPRAQGQGLARRAVVAVTAHALGTLGLARVYADVDPGNAPSVRVFERAGYRLEGHLVANWVTDGGVVDSLIYAATRGWAAPEAATAPARLPVQA